MINEGSPKFDTAYFDINHLRVYTLPGAAVSSVAPSQLPTGTGRGPVTESGSGSAAQTSGAGSGAVKRGLGEWGVGVAAWTGLVGVMGTMVGAAVWV